MNQVALRSETSAWKRDAVALALLALLVALFFWRQLTPRSEDWATFPPGDFTDQFLAFRMYEAHSLAVGRLPLWSENYNSGHPFLADVQSAIYYPVGLLFTLGAVLVRGGTFTLYELQLEAIFHFLLAGAFTYSLARRLLGSRAAALVSAVTFAFGGYLTSYPPLQLAILETATWLPLALLLIDLGIASSKARYYAGAGVVLGTAALAGHPQTFLFVVYASAIFFVWRRNCARGLPHRVATTSHRVVSLIGSLVPFVFAISIALGIASAQWVPTLEYQAVSTRAALSWSEAARGFPTIDPLQMILPGFVAAFQSPLYIGILPLWLAFVALVLQHSRDRLFWAGLALGSLIVAFGFYVFGYALLYLLAPGFGMFRDQERLAFIVSFALALLAGYGFRDLVQPEFSQRQARRAWALLPAGITLTVMLLFVFYSAATVRSSGRLAFLLDRAGLMVLVFALATVLAWARVNRRLGSSAFVGLALALIVFDLFSVNSAAYNAQPAERYPANPLIQKIKQTEGVFRVADEGRLPGHFGIGYDLEEIGGISPLRVSRYDALLELTPETLFPLLNVRYLITGRPGFANAEVIASDGETRLVELKNVRPRAWLVGEAVATPDDRAALEAMAKTEFNPAATAYVADPLPFDIVPNQAVSPVTIETREPQQLVISFATPTDSLLMLSEVYYPGWSATVDGAPAPVVRADVALRAVPVRAGKHRIEMIFDPWSVKIGLAITLLTLGVLVAGTVRLLVQGRSQVAAIPELSNSR